MAGSGRVPLEAALVRVWRGDVPLGAGFLAGWREVLTAAHVVADVLGVPATDPMPGREVRVEVDFPLVEPGRRLQAAVVAWSPVDELLRGDVAGLRLLDSPPDGAAPLVLVRTSRLAPDQLIMVGFPRGLEFGSWIYGRRGGRVASGRVEIQSEPGRESTLEPGFSGSPVWAPELDAAIGMVAQWVRGAPPKIGYMVTVDTLLSAWPRLAEVIERRPPFRPLRPFAEEDAPLFFGREEQAAQLAQLARTEPVVCVVGPSGVGKSSLLHAGVFPRLRAEPDHAVTVLRPSDGSTPTHALASAFDRLVNPGSPANERLERVDGLVRRIAGGEITDVVTAALARQRSERLLVAVDQFEEIFDFPEPAQASFTKVLLATRRPGARWSVLLNLRDTFLGVSLTNLAVLELATRWHPFTVADLTTSQLRAAITRPLTRVVGTVNYQDGLVERLLDDVQGAPSPLPLLQFTLAELWARRRGGQLHHDAYEELGGVRGALAAYASDVWAGLDPRSQADAARLLVQVIRPLPDTELWVRRTAHRDELDDAQWAIAQRLAGSRLLVLRGAPRSGVELAHESLLEHWQKLRELANEHRDFRLWQENLRQRIGRWSEESKAPRRLLSGLDLREAGRWAERQPENLSPAELDFLALSRGRRRRRWSAAALALLVIAVAAATTYRSAAQQRADLAAGDLAMKSTQLAPYDSYGALQLALRAYRTDPGVHFSVPPQGYPGVDRLLPDYTQVEVNRPAPTTTPSTSTGAGDGGMDQVSRALDTLSDQVSADGTRMVTTNSANQVVVWTIDGDEVRSTPLTSLFTTGAFAAKVTISRSGRYLAFEQHVFPVLPDTSANAPVDDEGLPEIDPDEYPTCELTSIAEAVTCLVVYDIDAERVTAAIPLGGATVFTSMIGIDPDDRVVAAMLPAGLNRASVEGSDNTLRRWDLRTGGEWDPVRIPWRSWPAGMWLRPGGASAVVWEFMPDQTGTRPDHLALTLADFGPAPRRRELAHRTLDVVMSLDWRTVAAIELPQDGSSFAATVWSTESGDVTTRISGLSTQQGTGSLALTRNGTALALLWRTPTDPDPPTDIRRLVFPTQRLTVWSLPDGAQQSVPGHLDLSWARIVPLADSMDGPLALGRTTAVGLVLPRPRQAPPLHRLADATDQSSRLNNGQLTNRLCALLADPNTDTAVQPLVPRDASQEPLCPNS